MEKVYAMEWLFIYARNLVACYVVFLSGVHFLISFKNDFHVNAERMMAKTQEI